MDAAGNEPAERRARLRRAFFVAANVVLAGYLAWQSWRAASAVTATSWPLDLAKYAGTAVIAVLVLFRSEPLAQRIDAASVAAVLVSNWNWLFFDSDAKGPEALRTAGEWTFAVAAVWASWARIVIGRSYAMLPALRGLRTGGPYRVVRHPIYLSLVVGDLAMLAIYPSAANAALAAAGIAAHVARVVLEERVLSMSPEWAAYAARTRARLVPGVW